MSSGTCWHCEADHDTGDCPTRKQWTKEQEPSEPGCICGRGVRCPLHGGPPQPGPEPMTTERQPGSPGVDLDHLDFLHAEATSGLGSVAGKMKRFENFSFALMNQWGAISAELRTLRARVESYAMDLAALEGTNAAKEGALRVQLERLHGERFRAESAEARVKELEVAFFVDAGETHDRLVALVESKQARITDLESQLAAAREEQELALQVRDWLREECIKLIVAVRPADGRWVADLFDEDDPENFFASVEAKTLPALLRAILEVEAKGAR